MNFTYTLQKPPDGKWVGTPNELFLMIEFIIPRKKHTPFENLFQGSLQPDGSWNGMVHELQKERADMGTQ